MRNLPGETSAEPFEAPNTGTEEDAFIKRGRIFLASAYSSEAFLPEDFPNELIHRLMSSLPEIMGVNDEHRGHTSLQLERLGRWLNGETSRQIAKVEDVSHQAVSSGSVAFANHLKESLPLDNLIAAAERVKNGEPAQETIESLGRIAAIRSLAATETDRRPQTLDPELQIKDVPDRGDSLEGEIDLDAVADTVVEVPRKPSPKKRRKGTQMTSAEFWKSRIRPPKTLIVGSKFRHKPEETKPLDKGKPRTETIDGQEFTVFALPGYTGPAPSQERKKPIMRKRTFDV